MAIENTYSSYEQMQNDWNNESVSEFGLILIEQTGSNDSKIYLKDINSALFTVGGTCTYAELPTAGEDVLLKVYKVTDAHTPSG